MESIDRNETTTIERERERDPRPNGFTHLDWETLAIWSFVVVSFATFFMAVYVVWTKCHGK